MLPKKAQKTNIFLLHNTQYKMHFFYTAKPVLHNGDLCRKVVWWLFGVICCVKGLLALESIVMCMDKICSLMKIKLESLLGQLEV